MGWRYRKSVKIMPGVRLNFTNRGMSASLGPRGSSVSVSRRGTYLNQSFLGFAKRTKLSGGSTPARRAVPDAERRSTWAAEPANPTLPPEAHAWYAPHRAWQAAEAARTAEPSAPEPRQAAAQLLEACQGGLLRSRAREPIDWGLVAARASTPRRFVSAIAADADRQRRLILNAMLPWTLWAYLCAVLGVLLLLGRQWVPGLGLLLLGGAKLARDYQQRHEGLTDLARADQELEAAMREAHEVAEAEREAEEAARRALAVRVVAARETGDTAPLAEVLEIELANEDLPLALEFDVAFDGPERVGLEIRLPTLDLVPTSEPATTPGGKPTTKAIGIRRRAELYRDLCAGLALRLIYETFRVLSLTREVTCTGYGPGRDPATGQPAVVTALAVRVTRAAMESLDLDHVDASTCLEAQGGRLGVGADGALKPVAAPPAESSAGPRGPE
jgi:hypothetical protein